MTDTTAAPESAGIGENFAALLEDSLGNNSSLERRVVKGTVVSVEGAFALRLGDSPKSWPDQRGVP